ncbi:MAG: hypothetical protein HZA89_17770 [Verrucomicrobia bacterium]|nr:hypothetical protein [Verrucomicrobiota bacterium]
MKPRPIYSVAQTGSLLFRRLAVGGAAARRGVCRLPVGDPADCQSALRERGVALVVSLLMLSVVTFIAIAFLAVSNRERASVTIAASRAEAKFMAEAMLARAQSDLLAQMISATNRYDYGLRVSTNLIARWGFTNSGADVAHPLNVAYTNNVSNLPLDGSGNYPAQLQMLANLQYDARPPVFIRTNNADTLPAADANFDFRYYLDFNRNGMYDTNGYLNEVDGNGVEIRDANKNIVTRNLVGDPEWIGFLEYPDRPHGPTNRFIGRGAFLVLPMGKSLDLNFIHNQAKIVGPPAGANTDNLFYRNQGAGTWEINLASFLVDLNVNMWRVPNGNGVSSYPNYFYNTNAGSGKINESIGVAFTDARALLNYRYESNFTRLYAATNTFGNSQPKIDVIQKSFVDLYSDGPLMLGSRWQVPLPPPLVTDNPIIDGWPGSFAFSTANLTPYYDVQELFTTVPPAQEPAYPWGSRKYETVRNALVSLGRTNYPPATTNSTYDRYTVYRMLDQLGVSSELPAGRMNINFSNITAGGSVVSPAALVAWEPVQFFTNAAHRLLRQYYPTNNHPDSYDATDPVTGQFAGNPGGLYGTNGLSLTGTNANNGWTNFMIYPRNFYTPNVHRILQLAANIYDATRSHGTNFINGVGVTNYYPTVPSVFRPYFYRTQDGNGQWIVSIAGYEQVTETNSVDELFFIKNPWYDLGDLALNGLGHGGNQDADGIIRNINVYGIPAVVGAKKYLPNFNEFAMQTWVTGARRLQVAKTAAGFETNVAMVFALTNILGMEIANAYTQDYPRGLEIRAWNHSSWYVTNSTGAVVALGAGVITNLSNNFTTNLARSVYFPAVKFNQTTVKFNPGDFKKGDFITNGLMVPLLPESVYFSGTAPEFRAWPKSDTNTQSALFVPLTSQALASDLTLVISNSFQCLIVDYDVAHDQQYRVIDCVNLANMTAVIDISNLFYNANTPYSIAGYNPGSSGSGPQISLRDLWNPTPQGNSTIPYGAFLQMYVSRNPPGSYQSVGWQWNGYANLQGAGTTNEINAFRAFLGNSPVAGGGNNYTPSPSNLVWQAPFVPAQARALDYKWQANDPLVHYTLGDLMPLPTANVVPAQVPLKSLAAGMPSSDYNIGKLNERYEPWGRAPFTGVTNAYNFAIKDPGITRPDDWDFPANADIIPGSANDFPTNYFANVGWLGRVHRGTPWQTVYLKSAYYKDQNNPDPALRNSIRSTQLFDNRGQPVLDTNGVAVTNFNYLVTPRDWQRWAGGVGPLPGGLLLAESHPTNDAKLFNVFSATYGGTAERGLLSVNQTNLAAWSAVLGGVMVLSNDLFSANVSTPPSFMDLPIDPSTPPRNSQMINIVQAINEYRATNFVGGVFTNVGNVLGVPELTIYSPYLNGANPSVLPEGDATTVTDSQIAFGMTDAAYERIPQQVLSLLQIEPFPRFIIYAYGQALRPADRSVVVDPTVLIRRPDGAPDEYARGMCTNYQITAEVALRVQVRVERLPGGVGPSAWMNPETPPRIVIESFKLLPAIEY